MPKFIALVFFALICLIIYAANTHQPEWLFFQLDKIPNADKTGHFFLFGLLALVVNWALRFRYVARFGIFGQLGSIAVLAFALLEEVSQHFFPMRTFDFVDVAFGFAGIVFFTLVSVAIARIQKRRRKESN